MLNLTTKIVKSTDLWSMINLKAIFSSICGGNNVQLGPKNSRFVFAKSIVSRNLHLMMHWLS
jgi:hypothetical protein